MLYDKVAGIAFFSAIVWTVLHEMGHHALHHTMVKASSLKDSRADELAADQWAFERMEELGYSLYPLTAFFLARMWAEDCFKAVGFAVNEAERTHPSWLNRGRALYKRFKWRRAANQFTRVYFIPALRGDTGKPMYFTISINDRSSGQSQTTMVQFGRTNLGIVEWVNKQAIVYTRGATGGRFEFALKNPDEVMVNIEQREYDAKNRFIRTVALQGVQQDTAMFDFLTVGGLSVGDVRARAESGDTWKRHLRALGVSDALSKQARATRDRYISEKHKIEASYMKGEETAINFERRLANWGARYKSALTNILGAQTYERLISAVTREVNMASPNIFGQDLEWEKRLLKENFGQ
jgi:hypothetical protein